MLCRPITAPPRPGALASLLSFLCLAFLVLQSGALGAQPAETCAGLVSDSERLSCYDRIYRSIASPPVPPTSSVEDKGDWQVSLSQSALDDTPTVVLRLESANEIARPFGGRGTGSLYLRCQENTTVAYFVFAGHFMSDIQGGGRVDYRIDDHKAQRTGMEVSSDNKALGLWSGGSAIAFIKSLIGSRKLVIRATPFNESPVELTFNTAGLEAALKPLKAACKW